VKTALDAGAEGIVFPLVTTAETAADCVALTRYPPKGRRGWGPFVAHSRWGVNLFDYYAQRGGETVCVLLIGTRSAVDHIQEICKVEGRVSGSSFQGVAGASHLRGSRGQGEGL